MDEAAAKIKQIYQQKGLLEIFKKLYRLIFKYVFETNSAIWFESELDNLETVEPNLMAQIDFVSNSETITWLKTMKEPWMYIEKEVDTGLKEKHYFVNIKVNGQIVGYLKIGVNKVYIADYKTTIDLEENSAFFYDIYIAPSLRKHNLASYLAIEAMKFLKTKGIKKVALHIPNWNLASLNTAKKLGFHPVEYVRHIRLFNFIKFWQHQKFEKNG